jgi:hypothetical protein
MEDKDLIQKFSILKEIKLRDEWVLLVKTRIFADSKLITADTGVVTRVRTLQRVWDTISLFRYLQKPAFVLPLVLFFVFGGVTLQISKNSLPGDALFSVKSVFEKATLSNLELAQKRLEDLRKIAQENKVRNLSETIKEFKLSVEEVSKGFSALVEKEPGKAVQAGRELVQLQKDKAQLEQALGTVIGEEESSEIYNTTKILVESELTYLLNHTLTEDQKALLKEALLDYQAEDYEVALEKIWKISNAR